MNILGHKHLKEFSEARIPYKVKAETSLTKKGAFGSSAATTNEIFTLYILKLTTFEGLVEFKTIQQYLHENLTK